MTCPGMSIAEVRERLAEEGIEVLYEDVEQIVQHALDRGIVHQDANGRYHGSICKGSDHEAN